MTKVLFLGLVASLMNALLGDAIAAAGAPMRASFQTVLRGYQSGVREPLETVARNQINWETLWRKHVAKEANPPTPPLVDFNKEIVVAVFLGERPTGGHDIEITKVEQTDGKLVVSVVERKPPPGSLTTQAFTQPFHIIKVAAQGSQAVSFRRLP